MTALREYNSYGEGLDNPILESVFSHLNNKKEDLSRWQKQNMAGI